MASADDEGRPRAEDNAKLELPSFRRRRRERPSPPTGPEAAPPPPEPTPEPERTPEIEPHPELAAVRRPVLPPLAPLPQLPAPASTALTGLLVGLLGAALTWASLRGCEAVRGTETCGGGPGLLLLVVIVVVMVLLGGLVLALLGVDEPRGTSFLGVGVLTVVLLVGAIEQLLSGWMFLVVPVLAAAAYLLAGWVTSSFVEAPPEKGPAHDVR